MFSARFNSGSINVKSSATIFDYIRNYCASEWFAEQTNLVRKAEKIGFNAITNFPTKVFKCYDLTMVLIGGPNSKNLCSINKFRKWWNIGSCQINSVRLCLRVHGVIGWYNLFNYSHLRCGNPRLRGWGTD